MNRIAIRERALEIALGEAGVREVGGNNRGSRVEEYLRAVGLPPGQPWCCAFVLWCYEQACAEFGVKMLLPSTGKCARLWQRTPTLWLSKHPSRGAIAIRLNRPEDRDTPGHAGIVLSFSHANVSTWDGNSDGEDDQDGAVVGLRVRRPAYWFGYIDIGREGPAPK